MNNVIKARIVATTFALLAAGAAKGYTSRTTTKIAAECGLAEDTVRTVLDSDGAFDLKTRRSDGATLVSYSYLNAGDMAAASRVLRALMGKHKLRTIDGLAQAADLTRDQLEWHIDGMSQGLVDIVTKTRRSDGATLVGLEGYEPEDEQVEEANAHDDIFGDVANATPETSTIVSIGGKRYLISFAAL